MAVNDKQNHNHYNVEQPYRRCKMSESDDSSVITGPIVQDLIKNYENRSVRQVKGPESQVCVKPIIRPKPKLKKLCPVQKSTSEPRPVADEKEDGGTKTPIQQLTPYEETTSSSSSLLGIQPEEASKNPDAAVSKRSVMRPRSLRKRTLNKSKSEAHLLTRPIEDEEVKETENPTQTISCSSRLQPAETFNNSEDAIVSETSPAVMIQKLPRKSALKHSKSDAYLILSKKNVEIDPPRQPLALPEETTVKIQLEEASSILVNKTKKSPPKPLRKTKSHAHLFGRPPSDETGTARSPASTPSSPQPLEAVEYENVTITKTCPHVQRSHTVPKRPVPPPRASKTSKIHEETEMKRLELNREEVPPPMPSKNRGSRMYTWQADDRNIASSSSALEASMVNNLSLKSDDTEEEEESVVSNHQVDNASPKVRYIIEGLKTTEVRHLQDLQDIIPMYMYVVTHHSTPEIRERKSSLFSLTQKLLKLQSEFQEQIAKAGTIETVLKMFGCLENLFAVYKQFFEDGCANFIISIGDVTAAFHKDVTLGGILSQRLEYYRMFLQILKAECKGRADFLEQTHRIITRISQTLGQEILEVVKPSSSSRGRSQEEEEDIMSRGYCLLRNSFKISYKIDRSSVSAIFTVLLFEKEIIFTKEDSEGKLYFNRLIKLDEVMLLPDHKSKKAFKIRHYMRDNITVEYGLKAENEGVGETWRRQIEKILLKQYDLMKAESMHFICVL